MESSRFEIYSLAQTKKEQALCQQFNDIEGINVANLSKGRCYLVSNVNKDELIKIQQDVFFDDIVEKVYSSNEGFEYNFDYFVDVTFRPGVTDNSSKSCAEALSLFGHKALVFSSDLYLIKSDSSKEILEEACKLLVGNDLIQNIDVRSIKDENLKNRFKEISLPLVNLTEGEMIELIDLEAMTSEQLIALSTKRCLALNLGELEFITQHFKETKEARAKKGLPPEPTDVEVEVLAQTWSEHCKHKIFSAEISYKDENNKEHKINGLYKSMIKASTEKIRSDRKLTWLTSVFTDNAGIVRFDKNVDLCIKVETHNSPSALDPYGGALTGILGVNRDILGCGLGAKPIANMDVFCFADPKIPNNKEQEARLPQGLMNPIKILEGVHQGVEDGGNKSGIPTVNGSMVFDRDYAGKPLVFVGTVGVMPQKLNDGRKIEVKCPELGDHVMMVGGAIGADGIHGATFSSLELNEDSPATAVQIGDPLTQKRVLDFIIDAREKCLFTCITDNGAGGLSSSVGEMATLTNGVTIDLKKCPTKYNGLKPYELMISESQERMTVAVSPKHLEEFLELSKFHGVESTAIGNFHDKGDMDVYYGEELVASLDLEFLHEDLPQMKLDAYWDGPREREDWLQSNKKVISKSELSNNQINEMITTLLESPNIASKEKYVRRYDHEVQAATAIKPFNGENGHGPSNAGGIWLYPHGGEDTNGIMISNGLCPRMSLSDPYLMAQMSVDEALRNVVSQGGDPDHCVLLDNFCWPDPEKSSKNQEGDYKLGQLVKACQGLYDITTCYGTPLVSGKDSMKNDFRGKNRSGDPLKISVLPTLLVTAMSKCTINRTMTSDFKNVGDHVYLLGGRGKGILRSELLEYFNLDMETKAPTIDINKNIELYRSMYKASQSQLMNSCHDVSDGGMILALVESCFGNELGLELNFTVDKTIEEQLDFLFNEAAGRFVVSVSADKKDTFESHFGEVAMSIGQVINESTITHKDMGINLCVKSCLNTWKGALL
jgi:phosphoribosylformylglycinamidine synthase